MSVNLRSADAILALQSLPRIGPTTALRVAIRSGWAEPPVDLGILESAREKARELLFEYAQSGVAVLTFFDEAYRPLLRQINDAGSSRLCDLDQSVTLRECDAAADGLLFQPVGDRPFDRPQMLPKFPNFRIHHGALHKCNVQYMYNTIVVNVNLKCEGA